MDDKHFPIHAKLEARHWWFRARGYLLRTVITRLLGGRPAATILDIGCGTGGLLGTLDGGYTRYGVDPTPLAIELARRAYPTLQFRCGRAPADVEDWLAAADVVLLLDVLEHVEHDGRLLDAIVARLKPEAHVLVTVPADRSLWSPHDDAYGHFRRYSREDLAALARNLPVEVLALTPFCARLRPLAAVARRFRRWRAHAAGTSGSELKLPPRFVNQALEWLFRGETPRVLGVFAGRPGYQHGLSLLLVLKVGHAESRGETAP